MRTLSFMPTLTLCLTVLALSGCGPRPWSIDPATPGADPPVILHLETRHAMVTIMAGSEGRLYTIRDRAGQVLGQRLSERELQVRAPEIHHLMKRSHAQDEGTPVIWAGMLEHDRLE